MKRAIIVATVLLATLSACAPLATAPLPAARYYCDGGRVFSLAVAPSQDSAIIDISGMRFELLAAASTEPGEQRYSCSMVELWRYGNEARVRMDGSPLYTGCRLQH